MKIHEYNEMMAYLTRPAVNRTGFKHGGTWKDYMLRGEEYKDLSFEEWLREDKAQGGVIGKGGMFQGEDMGHRTGFKKLDKRVKYEGPRRLYAGRMMTEEQIEALRERRLVPKQEGMTWDKKTKSFKPRKDFSEMSPQERKEKFTAPKAAETKKLKATKKLKDFVEKFKLENDGKLPTQQQIMRAVGGKSETVQKYLIEGVDYAKRATKQEAGKLAGKQFGDLTEEAQIAIKEHFHDVDIDFSKNADGTYKKGKYGIEPGGRGESKALYEQIRRFVGTPSEWKYAYNLGAADGWLLSQMDRAGYEPIWEDIKGNKKIIGHIDPDGKKYYGAKKWADKYDGLQVKTFHPDYKATKKLVDITNKTRTLPNKAIRDLLTKYKIPVNTRLQLNHLINYLIDQDGVDLTKSALEKHHVKGAKTSPTKDIQLVTRIANSKAIKIRNEIESGVFDRIDVDERLKKLGITLDVKGSRYGGKGFTSFKGIENFVFKNLKEELSKADKPTIMKIRKALGCMSEGGRVGLQGGGNLLECPMAKLAQDPEGTLNQVGRAVPETRTPIINALKNFGMGTLKWGGRAFVGLTPIFAGMEIKEQSRKFKEGVPAGQLVADLGEWVLPGVSGAYKAKQKSDMIKDIANPEELKILDKKAKYDSAKEMFDLGAIGWGEEERAAKEMAENQLTEEEELSLSNLEKSARDLETFKMERLSAERAARPLPEIDPWQAAEGGRAGFGNGSGLPIDPMDPDRKLNAVISAFKKLSKRTQNMIGFKNFFEIYAKENFNQGGRVGFKDGSPKDPKRRLFLKGITALAALPLVGKYFKLGKVLEKAQPYTGPAVEKIKGMPEWFPSLVKKLWNEGEDVTKQAAYGERQVVKRGTLEGGDDVDLIYQTDTGDVSIEVVPKKGEFSTKSGAYEKSYGLEYKKGIGDESTKGTPPDEFGVTEARPFQVGKDDVDWDYDMIDADEAMSDLTELENFAKKK